MFCLVFPDRSFTDTVGDTDNVGKIDALISAYENNHKVLATSKINAIEKSYDIRIKKKLENEKRKWERIKSMSLAELEENGYIKKLCKKYGMSKVWFDRISTVESNYGVRTPSGSYNAWGWGIYGNKVTVMGKNWYDSSDRFIREFVRSYGKKPSKSGMRRYCPSGAYDKFF